MNNQRVEMIKLALEKAFTPAILEIIDDSHLHVGHASAGGAGHFRVKIVSTGFENLSRIQRHQAVFQAMQHLLQSEVHALSIEAKTPEEICT